MAPGRGPVVFVALVVLVTVGVLVVSVGAGVADHGAEDADYTVEPMAPEDRQPGATNVRYGQLVVAEAGVDFRTLEELRAVYEEGSWARCGPEDGEVWGIDRGNTHDGYEIDERLEENTRSFSTGEDVFEVQLYGEDDFGSSTHIDDGDAVVSVAKCIDNPDEPGWYQISGSTTGVTRDGERRTFTSDSHYFWICDCENEAEAREKLGPPPSEPDATSTPTSTAAETDADEQENDDENGANLEDEDDGNVDNDENVESDETGATDEEPTASPEETRGADTDDGDADEQGTGGRAVTATPTASEAATGGPTPTRPAAEWDRAVVNTPTPGDGAGPGGPAVVTALLLAALLFRRRL